MYIHKFLVYLYKSIILLRKCYKPIRITFISLYYSRDREHQELLKEFKETFADYRCLCDPRDSEAKKNCPCLDLSDLIGTKPQPMETKEARASGKRAGAKQRELDGYLDSKTKPRRGLKTEVKNTMKKESFKDEAVFFKYFGDDWDMIKRIAVDPAHQFSNLVKDYLALILDLDSKKFRFEDLTKEQKHGRFKDIEMKNVPWHVSKKFKVIITKLQKSLKIPDGWPMMLDFFSDDYERIKIAEAMAFTDDMGVYFTNLTDIRSDYKELFIELLKLSSTFVSKTPKTAAELKDLQKHLVCTVIILLCITFMFIYAALFLKNFYVQVYK